MYGSLRVLGLGFGTSEKEVKVQKLRHVQNIPPIQAQNVTEWNDRGIRNKYILAIEFFYSYLREVL